MSKIFERGDVIRVRLNPVAGRELQEDSRPGLVLSVRAFNRLGMTLVAPITQGGDVARVQGFAIPLMGMGTKTGGVVLVNGVRMMDLQAREAVKIELAPTELVDEVLAVLSTITE